MYVCRIVNMYIYICMYVLLNIIILLSLKEALFFLLIIGVFSLFSIIFMPYLESNITSNIFYLGFTVETLRSVRTTDQNLKNLGTHFLCT